MVNEFNRQFSKRRVQMTNNYMKKCSTSLAVKEMQIKMTLRFHLTPVRMAIPNSTQEMLVKLGGWGGEGTHKLLLGM
jgi:hypothetical protein